MLLKTNNNNLTNEVNINNSIQFNRFNDEKNSKINLTLPNYDNFFQETKYVNTENSKENSDNNYKSMLLILFRWDQFECFEKMRIHED